MMTRFQGGAIFAVSFLASTLAASAASANADLNCSAYAGMAVAQQEQNVALGCGLSGGAWSADFQGHFAWCNTSAKMADLVREDEARKQALADCAAKPKLDQVACQEYAANAVMQTRMAQQAKCGLAGGRWSDDYPPHFDWCLGAAQAQRDDEARARELELSGCLAARKSDQETRCLAYAEAAVIQNEDNLARSCGFTGGRWSDDSPGHFDWCMGASEPASAAEGEARNAALRDGCKKPVKKTCWTETKAVVGIPPWRVVRHCKTH
ncbi:MAG: hypothetical protein GY937_28675 [bacterium]|nr:hypothetical protein [bacterium]